jgi:hypothetical protein
VPADPDDLPDLEDVPHLYEDHDTPAAELVETSGGKTMVKLTTVYKADFGEYLKVVGGPVELGAWDAAAAPALTWSEGDMWTATLELPPGAHELKVGVWKEVAQGLRAHSTTTHIAARHLAVNIDCWVHQRVVMCLHILWAPRSHSRSCGDDSHCAQQQWVTGFACGMHHVSAYRVLVGQGCVHVTSAVKCSI